MHLLVASYVNLNSIDRMSRKLMTNNEVNSMSVDELWQFHERVNAQLSRKLLAGKAALEKRLYLLDPRNKRRLLPERERRAYPKVYPKFRNPKNRGETWAGRGKQQRWLAAQLRSGKKLEDFRIR